MAARENQRAAVAQAKIRTVKSAHETVTVTVTATATATATATEAKSQMSAAAATEAAAVGGVRMHRGRGLGIGVGESVAASVTNIWIAPPSGARRTAKRVASFGGDGVFDGGSRTLNP